MLHRGKPPFTRSCGNVFADPFAKRILDLDLPDVPAAVDGAYLKVGATSGAVASVLNRIYGK